MTIKLVSKIFSLLLFLLFSSSCARYCGRPLSRLLSTTVEKKEESICFAYKIFNYTDCIQYLDRDILRRGYTPIQISIVNNTDRILRICSDSFSFPIIAAEDVAPCVHLSVTGRVLGYGIPGLFIWPLLIPAVVDGIHAAEANTKLDNDFLRKSIRNRLIKPNCSINGLVFVNTCDLNPCFSVILFDEDSNERFVLSTNNPRIVVSKKL